MNKVSTANEPLFAEIHLKIPFLQRAILKILFVPICTKWIKRTEEHEKKWGKWISKNNEYEKDD